MKVLWVVNSMFPEAINLLTQNNLEVKESGGWLPSLANVLAESGKIEVIVAGFSSLVNETVKVEGKHIIFYVLPEHNLRRYHPCYENMLRMVYEECSPDVVHIHGTEYTHGLSFINGCGNHNVVVSIQGMPSVISRYSYAGLPESVIRRNITLKTILKGNLIKEKKNTEKYICPSESELLRRVNYVIGRTSWDRAHTWAINPQLVYFHCGEILRDAFYNGVWTYDKCTKHTIFLSQASRPLKGTHQLLKAMPLILRHYPDTKIRIAGDNIIDTSTWQRRLRLSGYGKILNKFIKQYNLEGKVTFTGPLNAEDMKAEYLRSNVFVSPSSIENSPNSLCEAQVLGVPCVASYVGGVMDFIPNEHCGKLYRFDDVEMLAKAICDTFEESVTYDNTEMREMAHLRHDREIITNSQMDIYKKIFG